MWGIRVMKTSVCVIEMSHKKSKIVDQIGYLETIEEAEKYCKKENKTTKKFVYTFYRMLRL